MLDPKQTGSLFDNSIPITNMHALEWLAYYIDPPRWPEAAFGAIKPDLAAAGEAIFSRTCAGCHEYGNDQRTPAGLIRLRGMRPADTGTDATAALRISCPVPDTGALSIPPRSYSADDSQLLKDCAGVKAGTAFEGASFARTVQTAVDGIKRKAYAAAGIDAAQQRVMEDLDRRKAVTWRDTLLDTKAPYGPYAARPLYGIWAAAPFLHNGSVPTLYDLLLPPEQRPKTFALGGRAVRPGQARLRRRDVAAASRTAWSTPRGPATAMAATSGAPTCPRPTAWRCWNISRRTDKQLLGEGAVVFRRACRVQSRQLQQGLEDLRDLDLADVAAEAGVQAGGEVQVMVVGPAGLERLGLLHDARIEHGRPGQREDGRALRDQGRVRLARREMVVLVGHAYDHRIDGAEAERLEHEGRQCIVIVGLGGGSGLGQRVGHREQCEQRLDRGLRGGLDHTDDEPGKRAANGLVIDAVDVARDLQAKQPAHHIVLAVLAPGAALREQRIEPCEHRRPRSHGGRAHIGRVPAG